MRNCFWSLRNSGDFRETIQWILKPVVENVGEHKSAMIFFWYNAKEIPWITIWLFNIAMENPQNKWRFRSLGKSSISMGHLYHGYVSHNQRVHTFLSFPRGFPHWNHQWIPAATHSVMSQGTRSDGSVDQWSLDVWHSENIRDKYMGMDQCLLIPFLVGWTSIYQLFWCSLGVQGFDTLPYKNHPKGLKWFTGSGFDGFVKWMMKLKHVETQQSIYCNNKAEDTGRITIWCGMMYCCPSGCRFRSLDTFWEVLPRSFNIRIILVVVDLIVYSTCGSVDNLFEPWVSLCGVVSLWTSCLD